MDDDGISTAASLRGTVLEVGVDAIDREHADLFQEMRRLAHNLDAPAPRWGTLIEEIAERHRDHFHSEETLFETLDLAWLEHHRQTHHALLSAIEAIGRHAIPDERRLGALACNDLLFRHIVVEDMRYKWALYDLGRSDYDVRNFDRRLPVRWVVKNLMD